MGRPESAPRHFVVRCEAIGRSQREAYAQGNHEGGAALILFDCRPSDQVFRLILVPVGPGNVRAQLRGPLMSTERAVRTMTGLLRYVGVGWYP